MNDPSTKLPQGFSDLEPLVQEWSLESSAQRNLKRIDAEQVPGKLEAFYGAILPRLDAMLAYLNNYSLGGLTFEQRRLFALALMAAEAGNAVEVGWRREFGPRRFVEVRSLDEGHLAKVT